MSKIRVLLVDDHALVRSGLRALLESHPDIEVVGEAEDGVTVVALSKCTDPDVVLMDLSMPARGGVAAAEELRVACPNAKVIALTMHDDESYARQAFLAGIAGYVLKKSLATELIAAIRSVHRGKRYADPSLAHILRQSETMLPVNPAPASSLSLLTPREREVLGLIALGHTNSKIGQRLHISEKTVETHRAHILAKLGFQTRADLVRFAIEHGLIEV